jgi:hypothetical protein
MNKPWEPGKPRCWGADGWIVPVRAVTETAPRLWLIKGLIDSLIDYGGTRYEIEDPSLPEFDPAEVERQRAEWIAGEVAAAKQVMYRGSNYARVEQGGVHSDVFRRR